MDRQEVACPWNERLLSYRKGLKSCYAFMDGPRGHDAQSKKRVTKGHTVYDSTYMKCPEQVNLYKSELMVA